MPRIAISVVTLALVCLGEASAQAPVNFSGSWKTDSTRSESIHQSTPIGPITLVILQTPSEISIETRTRPKDRSAIANEKLIYKLDGAEDSTSKNADGPIVCKAHWDGSSLIAETARNLNGSTVTTRWVMKMDPAAKELTIQKTLTVQHGYQSQATPANNVSSATDVFLKTSAAAPGK
jgi:hypothetical protein